MRKRELDERVIQSRRKASSNAFGIMLWGMLAVLLYRQLYLGQDFKDYGDFFIVWLAACTYVSVASVIQGVKPFNGGRSKFLTVPAVMAVAILGTNLYLGRVNNVGEGVLILVVAFAGGFVTIYLLNLLYLWWEKRNLGEY